MSISARAISALTGAGLTGLGGYFYLNNQTDTKNTVDPVKPNHYDHRPFTLLSATEIDNRLRSGQFANKLQIKNVKATYTNQLASNNPVEDNFSIQTYNQGLIAGVYDGHIGPECSRLIKKQLPIYVARELETTKDAPETAITRAFELLDQDIQQRFYDIFPKDVSQTHEKDIRAAIASQPDQDYTKSVIEQAIHGSCACAVYIKDGYVYSANTGDSRVVIVSQDKSGKWTGRRLVDEQTPSDPAWKAYMISQHPDESETVVMRRRIFGCIAVGGSFGDIMYKVPVDYQMKVFPYLPYEIYSTFARYHHRIVHHYKTPPYLKSTPLVTRHALTPDDRYVVLGTDGLWDELSWDDCRSREGDQVAAEILSTKGEANPATHLLREALLYQAVYKNVGVKQEVEDSVLELSKRLTRKPSRSYRDDITITVIELDSTTTPPVFEEVGPVHETEPVELDVPRLYNEKKSLLASKL